MLRGHTSLQVLCLQGPGGQGRGFDAEAFVKARGSDSTVSLKRSADILKVVPLKYDTCLCSEKDYLMVGCLGGLGRSLSKWMLGRGARYFTFLSRNGVRGHSSAASELVADLRKAGAEVKVVQGDVAALPDVERAVQMISRPLGGVVQAAMGLKVRVIDLRAHICLNAI